MTLEIVSFVLGPVETNTYLAADGQSGEAVVIDPAADGKLIANRVAERHWRIAAIWLTHAHFDHLAGAVGVAQAVQPSPPIALHPADLPLWEMQGGAPYFGMHIDPGPRPTISLQHGQKLTVGAYQFEVRHAPGHTPGHVIFYCAAERLAFCGDVIFWGSIGRTDLPGGSYQTLLHSIRTQILTLPDETRLLSGHGEETTVGLERRQNPFLN
ncbi:MAG: MBL fold metallo-hydrolase [Anaerolineales bacterium]|nr:MBL fold metallo-hydrolase [Anaerolineales bacterium]